MQSQRRIVSILAITQVVSWGTLYYAFSVLAPEIQRELGWRAEIVFGAFSWSLLVAGLVSAPVGILLDRYGGRPVMGLGSVVAGAGLILLSLSKTIVLYFVSWSLIGLAMALVLYEAAFATITREFLTSARKGISTLTLFGGLASTVFWPVTLKVNSMIGWRETYFVYGALHLALCLPAHLLLNVRTRSPVSHSETSHAASSYTLHEALRHPSFWKLAFAFATNAFVFSALSVHLIPILNRLGHAMTTVIVLATLIGPMQVAGRIGEMAFASRTRPQAVGQVTFGVLPVALLTLFLFGMHEWAAAAFCILYGLSNGILTIVRGTVPQALFGHENYGAISGALAGPSLIAKAAGPLALGAMMQAASTLDMVLLLPLVFSLASLVCYRAAISFSGRPQQRLS